MSYKITYSDKYYQVRQNTIAESANWFLPSKDELNAMYINLYLESVGDFNTVENWYWSSSEARNDLGYAINFDTGLNTSGSKTANYAVRPCRTFIADEGSYSLRDVGPAGGLIFYIDISGTTYFEAYPTDISDGVAWSNITEAEIGTTGTAIGTGQANTTAIIGQAGHTASAAQECTNLNVESNFFRNYKVTALERYYKTTLL